MLLFDFHFPVVIFLFVVVPIKLRRREEKTKEMFVLILCLILLAFSVLHLQENKFSSDKCFIYFLFCSHFKSFIQLIDYFNNFI